MTFLPFLRVPTHLREAFGPEKHAPVKAGRDDWSQGADAVQPPFTGGIVPAGVVLLSCRVVIAQGTLMQRYALPVPTTVSALVLAAVLLVLLPGVAARAAGAVAEAEAVEFREGDLTLKGMLFRPEGNGPFPAVIAMHNCAGLMSPSGTMRTRYRDWAQQLVKMGFVALFPDSYGPRGLGNECNDRNQTTRSDHERVADALAARHWLQQRPEVKGDRISLIGWSNGGTSVLWTVRPRGKREDRSDFRSAVVFYPACRRLDTTAWSARVPTLILIGALDDWSSPQECERMVADAKGRSARASIVVYPGALHDFDHPSRSPQIRSGFAFSADGSGRIHTGTNASARADAQKRVSQWLGQ
jgi:dienelactone hydrolase